MIELNLPTRKYEATIAGPAVRARRHDVDASSPAFAAAGIFRDLSGVTWCEIGGVEWERDEATGGARRIGGHGVVTIAH